MDKYYAPLNVKNKLVLLFVFFFSYQFAIAQCTDQSIVPRDPNISSIMPTCNGGSNGVITVTNIGSSSGLNINAPYTVRQMPSIGSTVPIASWPVPVGATSLIIPVGFAPGTYYFDVRNSCGSGDSQEVAVTVQNPMIPNIRTAITYYNTYTTSTCGDTFRIESTIRTSNTGQTFTITATNNLGTNLIVGTFTAPNDQTLLVQHSIFWNLSRSFFNNTNVTITITNNCGTTLGTTIMPYPGDVFEVRKLRNPGDYTITEVSGTTACDKGYQIYRTRWNGVNPIRIDVTDTGGAPVADLFNNIIPSLPAYNMDQRPSYSGADNVSTNRIPISFKYNQTYRIKYTDACGQVFEEDILQTQTLPNFNLICGNGAQSGNAYWDDTATINVQYVSGSILMNNPTMTILSGPATYVTQSGTGSSITVNMTYPIIYTFSGSPTSMASGRLPGGTYQVRMTADCGYDSGIRNITLSCLQNINISKTIFNCGTGNGTKNVEISIPDNSMNRVAYGFYNSAGVNVTSTYFDPTNTTIFNPPSTYSYTVIPNNSTPPTKFRFNGLPPGTYYFRYGGVGLAPNANTATATYVSVQDFLGVSALTPIPRFPNGFVYEVEVVIPYSEPLNFPNIVACNSTVNMEASGGLGPYQYSIYNNPLCDNLGGGVLLFGPQSSFTFNTLTPGVCYLASVTDSCGLTYSQSFNVYTPPPPAVGTVTQPTCSVPTGTVFLSGLPTTEGTWRVTVLSQPGATSVGVYTGTSSTLTVPNLLPGTYDFVTTIRGCTSSVSTPTVVINAAPICPTLVDDFGNYIVGTPITVSVLSNDTSNSALNPASVSIVGGTDTNADGFNDTLVVPGQGTWTVNPVTGAITFTPQVGFTGSPTSIQYTAQDMDGDAALNPATVTMASIGVTYTTLCSANALTYRVRITVALGTAPFTATGTGIPGSWVGNVWTSNAIPTGTPFNITITDSNLPINNTAVVSDVSPNCCVFDVTCPTFTALSVQCYEDLPSQTTYTKAEFEALGNGDGFIGTRPCGIIEITALNEAEPLTCNTAIVRSYILTEYDDTNDNGIRDLGENTVLNTQVCTQSITINDDIDPVFVEALPSNVTVQCNAIPVAPIITATDNCTNPQSVFYTETRVDGACANSYTLRRRWTATDECNNVVTHLQIITVQDTTPPAFVESLPSNATYQCSDFIPAADILTATDNCTTPQIVAFTEVSTYSGSGCQNYTITRTWTATDECNNAVSHTQVITVQDTTPPAFDLPTYLERFNGGITPPSNWTFTGALSTNTSVGDFGLSSPSLQFNSTGQSITTLSYPAPVTIIQFWLKGLGVDAASSLTIEGYNGSSWVVIDVRSSIPSTGTNFVYSIYNGTMAAGFTSFRFTYNQSIGNIAFDDFRARLPISNYTTSCDAVLAPPIVSATDNCTSPQAVVYNQVRTNGSCINSYTLTRTWTATDQCGNAVTPLVQVITVEDTTNPTMVTPASNLVVACDGSGNTAQLNAWLASFGGAHATDNCSSILTWTNNFTALSNDCGATGSATVTFTATDECGNSEATTATFTIEDVTKPTITTPASNQVVQCNGSGNIAQLNAWLASNGGAVATDTCSGVTWTNNFTAVSDDCGATGSATVTFTATDDCGNFETTTATFTIQDNIKPTITTPASNLVVQCDGAGNTAALNAWLASNGGAVATDTCSGVTWTNNFTTVSDACGATGTATVIFTATDDCGNSEGTTATFTIQDNIKPTITTPASNLVVQCDGAGNTAALNAWLASNGGAVATDTCSGVTWTNNFTTVSDACGATGTATVIFTATDDCGNFETTTATFTIQDTTKPTITTPGSNLVVQCDGSGNTAALNAWLTSNGGAVASDTCSSVTWTNNFTAVSDACGATGTATVIFRATDACGNFETTTATFTIEDTTKPTITTQASNMVVECNGSGNTAQLNAWLASNGGAVASDTCSSVTWTNNFTTVSDTCGATGSATVTFTATDACGNFETTTATYTIQDTTKPNISTPASDLVVECNGSGNTAQLNAWLASNGGAVATDTCSGVTWTNNFTVVSYTCGVTGSATVIFTATDACGNFETTTATFTIQDTTAPQITGTLPNLNLVGCSAAVIPAAATTVAELEALGLSISDNCTADSNLTVTSSDVQTATCPLVIERTYTVSDCLFSTTRTQIITIRRVDFTLPSNGGSTVACTSLIVPPTVPSVTDACGNAITPTGPVVSPIPTCEGNVTYTYTFTDCEGNSHDWVYTYVLDRDAFSISLPPNGTATVACPADVVAPTLPDVRDVCNEIIIPTGPVVTPIPTPTCSGNVVYTYTYTDCDGTVSNWTFTYTILPRADFSLPANGSSTVACPSDIVTPTVPTVNDMCGNTITPTGPVISSTPTCEGDVTYTYTYTDCSNNTHDWVYTYTIERENFNLTMPANGAATVACPSNIVTPTVPVVRDACNNVLTPSAPVISPIPTCEGDVTYTYTFVDCEGNSNNWVFTYTIERDDFVMPANGAAIVACSASIATPTVPNVTDACGNNITPTGPVISSTPACEGDVTYTYTFTDCEGNTHDWVFTYTIERNDFTVPANGIATVACSASIVTPTVPSVTDACGNNITPTGPAISSTPTCEGDVTYTYTFTDCEGNTHDWVFTYTIERADFTVPANGGSTVACTSQIVPPTVPTVTDACGNAITPTGPVVSPIPTCEGNITYTYTFTDCEGNSHDWVYTYVLDRDAFSISLPPNGTATVACPADAIPPTLPDVRDVCNEIIIPVGPVITPIPTPTCSGNIVYTYTYTDCDGTVSTWTYTYTILPRVDFVMPPNDGSVVTCPIATTVAPTVPEVRDACDNILTPSTAVVSTIPTCEGDVTYTYTFTDCSGNTHDWVYTYTIERDDFVMPPNDGTIVNCPIDATVPPTVPVIRDACNNVLTPSTAVVSTIPTCEGDVTYTYTFTDCEGNTHDWVYTYTIERYDFVMPADSSATITCSSALTLPTVPVVTDNCGTILLPTGPVISTKPICEGDVTYTYTFTDCEGNTHDWEFTYTIERADFTMPSNDSSIVSCASAITPPTVPVVTDNCGLIITPTGPVISSTPTCEGDVIYTYTFTDCEGNTHDWTYTYTIERDDFPMPPNESTIVNSHAEVGNPAPIVPSVTDACGNVLSPTPTSPVISPFPTCSGPVTYTYTFEDCEGNTHDWVYTYNVITSDFVMPPNEGSIVNCPSAASVTPTPPIVIDTCSGTQLFSGPPVVSAIPTCSGLVTYTYTFIDVAGDPHDWVYTYTIKEPLVSMPDNGTETVACAALAIDPTPPTIIDNCNRPLTVVLTSVDNDPVCVGTKVYTYTYKDCADIEYTWTYTYTISPPVVTLPTNGSMVVACADLAITPTPPTVTDNCNRPLTVVLTSVDNDPVCVGTKVYTYTYKDCADIEYTWTYTYTISPPVVTLPTNGSMVVACAALAITPTPPTITDNCNRPLTVVLTSVDNDPVCAGTKVYTYTYKDCADIEYTWTYTYTISPPVVTLPTNGSETVACAALAITPTPPTVTDNCNRAITPVLTNVDNDPVCEGTKVYTYTYKDCADIEYTWTYTYTIDDTIPPTGTAPADLTLQCVLAVPVADSELIIDEADNCVNNVSVTVTDSDNGGTGCLGNPLIITRTFTLRDCAGNSIDLVQTITVEDDIAPTFVEALPANIVLGCTDVVPSVAVLTATDNCSTPVVTYSENRIQGSCPNNYELVRTWTAKDSCDNETVHVQTILVEDVTPPVFTGELPQDGVASCDAIPVAPTLTATDICGAVTITFTETTVDGDCSSRSELIRTWTATDTCGNTSTHTQTITLSCYVKVWNAVSPNADGSNDFFYLEGIDCYPKNTVEVFNRWGVKIFETSGYDNLDRVFNGYSDGRGTISRNDLLPTGTYFYILKYEYSLDGINGIQNIEKSGFLYILSK
jgi:gliding motility-associated-like protein